MDLLGLDQELRIVQINSFKESAKKGANSRHTRELIQKTFLSPQPITNESVVSTSQANANIRLPAETNALWVHPNMNLDAGNHGGGCIVSSLSRFTKSSFPLTLFSTASLSRILYVVLVIKRDRTAMVPTGHGTQRSLVVVRRKGEYKTASVAMLRLSEKMSCDQNTGRALFDRNTTRPLHPNSSPPCQLKGTIRNP